MANEKDTALIASKTQQWIMSSINNPEKGITVPKGYNIGNEIETAMFYISQNTEALTKCSETSIISALRDMVLQGLSISKKQIYPIVYGNQLQMQRSYFGTMAILKRLFPNYEITANVLYEGDSYDYCYDEVGNYFYVTNVKSSLENRDKPIIAAFGTIYDTRTKERIYGCVMTKKEIDKNWAKGKTHNVQNDFPQEMAKRTLINRMCKTFINTASDLNSEIVGAYNRSTEAEYDDSNLQNVTPPESETEKRKMLNSKSTGAAGLKAILEAESKNSPQNASKEPEHEITHPEPENASEKQESTSRTKLGREPSVKINENGEIVPNDDGNSDKSEELFDFDSLPF